MESGSNHRREIGKSGEDIACRMLEGMGHIILERNWRSGHLEIDIISFNPEGVHFVEVKARKSGIQAPPQDHVNLAKQRRTAKAAMNFLRSGKGIPYGNHECFFDVVAVTFEGGSFRTDWFPQAYIPAFL